MENERFLYARMLGIDMDINEFNLAATTNDLTREPQAREIADIIEFRMDTTEDPITQLSEYEGKLPIIATNRGQWFGGGADDSGRLDHLFTAAGFDAVEMVDIELETARGGDWILDDFHSANVDIIISFHEFDNTPNKEILDAIIKQSFQYGDLAKVATFAADRADALKMLGAIDTATEHDIPVAGISMGEIGRHTRVISPFYGSKLGYAPLKSDTNEYAPGQIPLRELDLLIERMGNSGEKVSIIDSLERKFSTPQFGQSD